MRLDTTRPVWFRLRRRRDERSRTKATTSNTAAEKRNARTRKKATQSNDASRQRNPHQEATNEHTGAKKQDPPFSERGRSPRRRRRRPCS